MGHRTWKVDVRVPGKCVFKSQSTELLLPLDLYNQQDPELGNQPELGRDKGQKQPPFWDEWLITWRRTGILLRNRG